MVPSLLFAVAAAVVPCTKDAQGYCTDKIVRHELSYTDDAARIRLNAALGDVVSLEFPKGVQLRGEPALGNKAIFEFRAQPDPFRILVWPKVPAPGVTAQDLEGERTNLEVFLDSGVAVLVDVKIAPPKKSVQRVVFSFPARERESEFVEERIAEEARRQRAEAEHDKEALEEKITERVRRTVAKEILKRHECQPLHERTMRDLLIVFADQICRMGDLVTVRFRVRNRARDVFHLDEVRLDVDGQADGQAAASSIVEFSRDAVLAFGEEAAGVLVMPVEDAARRYALTVRESGGKKRVVTVSDVAF
jgi:hypothetical protein